LAIFVSVFTPSAVARVEPAPVVVPEPDPAERVL